MNYHELTRRELQTLCKQHGLPANKSNVAMADSLTALLSDSQTTTPAPVRAGTLSTAKKTRASKVETLETSLAALLLSTDKPRSAAGHTSAAKKTRELSSTRALEAEFAFAVPASTAKRGWIPLPKATPLRRRKKKSDVCLPIGADETICRDTPLACGTLKEEATHSVLKRLAESSVVDDALFAEGQGNLTPIQQEGADYGCKTVVKEKATNSVLPLADLVPNDALLANNQEIRKKRTSQEVEQPSLSPLLRIKSNVDAAIERATGMLERFERWKVVGLEGDVRSFSGQMQVSMKCEQSSPTGSSSEKENHGQPNPCKSLRSQKLPSYLPKKSIELDWKEGILKDLPLNAHAYG